MGCSEGDLSAKGRWRQFQGDDPAGALHSVVGHSPERQRQNERALLANAPGCCHSGCALAWGSSCMRILEERPSPLMCGFLYGRKAWHAALDGGMQLCRCTDLLGMSERDIRRFRCSKCAQARYCSKSCQRAAWATHRAVCADMAA
jgi:hypothetical protein